MQNECTYNVYYFNTRLDAYYIVGLSIKLYIYDAKFSIRILVSGKLQAYTILPVNDVL